MFQKKENSQILFLIFLFIIPPSFCASLKFEKCPYVEGCFYQYESYDESNKYSTETKLICQSKPQFEIDFLALNQSERRDECGFNSNSITMRVESCTTLNHAAVSHLFKLLKYTIANTIDVHLVLVKRINVEAPIQIIDDYQAEALNVHFLAPTLDFYDNRGKLTQTCDRFQQLNSTWSHLIHSKTNHTRLSLAFNNAQYSRPVCELVFKNLRIFDFDFGDVFETYFKANRPRFLQQSKTLNLNSCFDKVNLRGTNINVDKRILNEKIFRHVQRLVLHGQINSVQDDLFLDFKNLKTITISPFNLENLIKRQGLKWIKSINADLNDLVELSNDTQIEKHKERVILFLLEDDGFYEGYERFVDRQFCAYINWPFNQLVLIEINFFDYYNCVISWLMQHHGRIQILTNFDSIFNYSMLSYSMLNKIEMCNFTQQLSLCQRNKFSSRSNFFYFNSFEFLVICEFLLIVAGPIVSLVGIIVNSLVIAIVVKKRFKKEFEKKQYTYMVLFSLFNILVCFLKILSLINECQQPFGVFCSSARKPIWVQYFKIVFGEFFLNFFISLSNCTYVAFALCRLSLVGNNPNPIAKLISGLGVKKLTVIFCVFSFSITLVKPFMYNIEYNIEPSLVYRLNEFPKLFYKSFSLQFLNMKIFRLKIISSIVYDFVNYCLFVFVNITIDGLMLKNVRQVMREKEEKQKKSDQAQISQDKLKKDNLHIFKKLLKFVLINSLTNICLKIPICISSLNDFRLVVSKHGSISAYLSTDPHAFPYTMLNLCVVTKVCQVFQSFGHLLYIASLSVNFFVLRKFDRNYKQAFHVIFGQKTKK